MPVLLHQRLDALASLTGGTILLQLFTQERPELLAFLASPDCEKALASDEAFLAWAHDQLQDDPDLLHRIRHTFQHTREVLLAATHVPNEPKGDE